MVPEKRRRPALFIFIALFVIATTALLIGVMASDFRKLDSRDVIKDQYQEVTDQSVQISSSSPGYHKVAQSFKPTIKTLTNVSINLYKEGANNDTGIEIAIFDNSSSVDGTNPPNSSQNITEWVAKTASSLKLGSPGRWETFTLPAPIELNLERTYWLVVRLTGDNCSVNTVYQISESGDSGGLAYSNGVERYSTGVCSNFLDSASAQRDLAFRTYVYEPLITVDSPANTTSINYTWFNVTLLVSADWCGFSFDSGANTTMSSDSSTHFYYNKTEMLPGHHSVLFWCNFSENIGNQSSEAVRYLYVDETTPEYENSSTAYNSPTVYGRTKVSGFEIFAKDNFMVYGRVILSLYNDSWQNYTATNKSANTSSSWVAYHVNVTGLEVGNYTYKWYLWDGLHLNTTDNYTIYNVTQAYPTSTILLNGTSGQTYEWGSTVNITSYASDSALSTTLYSNFTGSVVNLTSNVTGQNSYQYDTSSISVGWYMAGANVTGNKNYFNNATLNNITFYVNDTHAPNITFIPQLQESFGIGYVLVNASLNENGSLCRISYDGGSNLSMDNSSRTFWFYNQSSPSEGNHTVTIYCNDSYGNLGYNQTWFLSDFTAPNTSFVTTSPASSYSYVAGQTNYFNVTVQDMGIIDTVILSMLGANYSMSYMAQNSSMSPAGKIYGTNLAGLGAGNHSYFFYVNDSLGNSQMTENYFFNITMANPYSVLMINGSSADTNIDFGKTANITSYPSDLLLSTTIYTNFSGSLQPLTADTQGVNTYLKNTGDLAIGTYIVAANVTGNANYSSNSTLISYYLTVQDSEKPQYSSVSVSPSTTLKYDTVYYFMSNWTDNYGIGQVLFSENSSGSYQNRTVTNISGSRYTYSMNATSLQGVNTLGWRFYCSDNSTGQNLNLTDIYQLAVAPKTTALLTRTPESTTIDNMSYSGQNVTIRAVVNNNGGNDMFFSNLSLALLPEWYANASYSSCGNLTSSSTCTVDFDVHVPGHTGQIGDFLVYVYANWTNPDHTSNSTSQTVTVSISAYKNLQVPESSVTFTGSHGANTSTDTFNLSASGNSMISSIIVNTTGGNLNSSWIVFINESAGESVDNITYSSIPPGSTEVVYVKINVPGGQLPGDYWTNATVYSDGGILRDSLYINLTVPEDETWSLDGSGFDYQTLDYGSSGTLGTINLTNTGNVDRKWTFGFSGLAMPWLAFSPTQSITVNRTESGLITVSYNLNGLTPGYYVNTLTITNTSASPDSMNFNITFSVQNLPPSFSSVATNQTNLETGRPVTISADVSDPSGVSSTWVTINLPNGSVENYSMTKNPNPSITWTKSFNAHLSGTYSYQVYANDTDNMINSTSVNYFFASPATTVSVSPTPSSISLDNMTFLQSNSTQIVVSLSNTGNVTAYYLNLTVGVSGNISSNSTLTSFSNLSSSSTNSSTYLITVAAGTPSGTYSIPLTSSWTNPNGSLGISSTNLQVVVYEKKAINITHDLDLVMAQMASELNNLTIYSFGNTQATSINLSCFNCSDIESSFSPSSFSVQPNSTAEIEMNTTIPAGKNPGNYTLVIYANGTGASSDSVVNLMVQENNSWYLTPTSMSLVSGKDNSGIVGYITVTNYGNIPLNLTSGITGDTSYLGINTSYVYVTPQTSSVIAVNYTSSSIGSYVANVTVSNSSGSPEHMNASINLTVLDLNISITSLSPSNNITAGETISMMASAFLEGSPLSSNVVWSATLNGTTCPVTQQSNIINEIWLINCTAPSVQDGLNYTLRLAANYTPQAATVFDLYQVNYADISAPFLYGYQYAQVRVNQTLNATFNISDNVMVDQVSAIMQFSNGTNQSATLSQGANTHIFNFSATQDFGEYLLLMTANDTSSNINTSIYAYFSVYTPIIFNGTIIDSSNSSIRANFSFVRPRSGTTSSTLSSDVNGQFNGSVNSTGNMTLQVSVFNSTVEFTQTALSSNKQNPFYFDDVPTTELSGKILKIFFINTTLSYYNATLTFDYTGTGFSNEDYIGIYKCTSWNFDNRTCGSFWTRLSSSKNKVTNIIQATSTSMSAYTLAEYICGDSTCDSSYGESCSLCSTDCGVCSSGNQNTGGTSGSGGSGGSGKSGNTTVVESNDKTFQKSLNTHTLRLKRGESENVFLNLLNRLGEPVQVSLSTFNLSRFVSVQTTNLEIANGTEEVVVFEVTIPDDTLPGSYVGDIIVTYNNKSERLPLSITVLSKGKKVSLSLVVISKEVSSTDVLRYRLVISNDGEEKDYPVSLRYTIKETATDRVLLEKEDNITMGTEKVTINNVVPLEQLDIQLSELAVEVRATYGAEATEAIDTFTVVPWLLKSLMSLEFWRIGVGIAILVFGAIPVYWSYDMRKRVIEKRKRYKIELNFDKIPSKGPGTAFVGKIAETERKTGLDLDNLTTHIMVAGATGSGKTVASQVIAEEALLKNKNVIVFDPSGQWTGFLRKSGEPEMMGQYKNFGIRPEETKAFNGSIKVVKDPLEYIDMKSLVNSGDPRIYIFVLNQLKPEEIDLFVANTVMSVFESRLPESKSLKTLLVYDEVHRLLPKFGGSGKGFIQVERGAREFRKWGLGLVLVSQVLSDFVGEIRANIGIEIQMRTRYEDDLSRLSKKYGENVSRSIVKAKVGTGLLEFSEYNDGKPYFVSFRPLLHQSTRLSDKELEDYSEHSDRIEVCRFQMDELKKRKIDVFDIEVELKLADQKLAQGQFDMSSMYLEGIENRLKAEWRRLGTEPPRRETQRFIDKQVLDKSLQEAEKARKDYVKKTETGREQTVYEKIENLYADTKIIVNECKKYGAETFVEEIELDRVPSTVKLLRMKQSDKDAEEFLEKLQKLKAILAEKLERSKEPSGL